MHHCWQQRDMEGTVSCDSQMGQSKFQATVRCPTPLPEAVGAFSTGLDYGGTDGETTGKHWGSR